MRWYLLIVVLLAACQVQDKPNKKQVDALFNSSTLVTSSSIVCQVNYDTLDQLKRLDTTYYTLFDSSFLHAIQPNHICVWKQFKISNKRGVIVTNSGYDGLLEAYMLLYDETKKQLGFLDRVAAFYELHNTGIYESSNIYFLQDSIVVERRKKQCDYTRDPQAPSCSDTTIKRTFGML